MQRRATRVDSKARCSLTGAPVVGGADAAMLLWPPADLVVLHGGRVFQESSLVSLIQEQPSTPPPDASAAGTGAWGSAGADGSKGKSGAGGVGAVGSEASGGGDGGAAAKLILQQGFVVEGKHFYRDGVPHGRSW